MKYFCTLFTKEYLSRGIVMIESLQAVMRQAVIYVFAFDDETYYAINKYFRSRNIFVISLKEFEDAKLIEVKPKRTKGEYCWTCTPSTILYCFKKFNIPDCTYIDADLYFYNSPKILFDRMGDASCLITPHHFPLPYFFLKRNGIFCVQFVAFKNTSVALKILQNWRTQCINWCYAYHQDGKYGDQKYLNDWPELYTNNLATVKDPELCLGPWNIIQYQIKLVHVKPKLNRYFSNQLKEPVFYHFHGLKILPSVKYAPLLLYISSQAQKSIYDPYITKVQQIEHHL